VRTHDPLLLLPTSPAANGSSSLWVCRAPKVFRYIGRRLFGEVYTLRFRGVDKWRCLGAVAARRERNCFTLRSMAGSWPSPFASLPPHRQSTQSHRSRCSPRVWAKLLSYPYNQQYDVSRWPEVPDEPRQSSRISGRLVLPFGTPSSRCLATCISGLALLLSFLESRD